MITEIEDYFTRGCGRCERFDTPDCATRQWREGLRSLRRICLEAKLVEVVKWGHPCYMHADRNIAIIGALRSDLRLSFFDAALMKDPDGVLERQGPNTRYPDMLPFRDNAQVAAMERTIQSYLREAMGYAETGIRPPRDAGAIELPQELVEVLSSDQELAEAFHGRTPGRQKSYVINLSSAKRAETRFQRMAKFRSHILAGKGALER